MCNQCGYTFVATCGYTCVTTCCCQHVTSRCDKMSVLISSMPQVCLTLVVCIWSKPFAPNALWGVGGHTLMSLMCLHIMTSIVLPTYPSCLHVSCEVGVCCTHLPWGTCHVCEQHESACTLNVDPTHAWVMEHHSWCPDHVWRGVQVWATLHVVPRGLRDGTSLNNLLHTTWGVVSENNMWSCQELERWNISQ